MIEFTKSPNFNHTTPASWSYVILGLNGPSSAMIVCPNCHIMGTISDHNISEDGTVTPSVICPECDFHDMIKLLEWKP